MAEIMRESISPEPLIVNLRHGLATILGVPPVALEAGVIPGGKPLYKKLLDLCEGDNLEASPTAKLIQDYFYPNRAGRDKVHFRRSIRNVCVALSALHRLAVESEGDKVQGSNMEDLEKGKPEDKEKLESTGTTEKPVKKGKPRTWASKQNVRSPEYTPYSKN